MNETAVILFCDAAAEGRRKGMPRAFLEVFHARLRERLARPAAFDLIPARELATPRSSLAEQIRSSIRAAFARGYRIVVLSAADVPALDPAHLLQAADAVRGRRAAAISSSGDGGFSVVAFSSDPALDWDAIALHTGRATEDLIGALTAAGYGIAFLPSLDDIDHPSEALALTRRFAPSVTCALLALLQRSSPAAAGTTPPLLGDRSVSALRGPPPALLLLSR